MHRDFSESILKISDSWFKFGALWFIEDFVLTPYWIRWSECLDKLIASVSAFNTFRLKRKKNKLKANSWVFPTYDFLLLAYKLFFKSQSKQPLYTIENIGKKSTLSIKNRN